MRILLRNAFLFYILISTVFAQTNLDTLDIRIKAITGMQYDQVRFRVEPGRYVRLILENTDEMEHNLVIGKKGAREEIIAAALALGAEGPDRGYIPSIPAVMYSIRLLRGGESDSIIFRAPLSTGVFPYVCTFPGHGTLMYGAMYVTNGVLPKLEIDDHVPLHRRKQEQNEKGPQKLHHPYPLLPPYLYRVLMPDAGPAAIAVALPDQINYCWDAGACRLRYAWNGEFLDMMDYWTVKGELHAKVLGTIFYRTGEEFPFTWEHARPEQIHFKGYRLQNGFPEFHYEVDGIQIYEMILPASGNNAGLIRKFKIEAINKPIYFINTVSEGILCSANKGKWIDNRLVLSPDEAGDFSITIMKTTP